MTPEKRLLDAIMADSVPDLIIKGEEKHTELEVKNREGSIILSQDLVPTPLSAPDVIVLSVKQALELADHIIQRHGRKN